MCVRHLKFELVISAFIAATVGAILLVQLIKVITR